MNDTPALSDLLEQVNDRESFFTFVRSLVRDRRAAVGARGATAVQIQPLDPSDWENDTIEDYLEAALAWAEDSNMGLTQGLPESPSWKSVAVFLYCGKIYE
jgi:hypothetical protein